MFFNGFGFGHDRTIEFDPADTYKYRVVCALSYVPLLFWLPLFCGRPYCRFHANQGLIATVCYVVINLISAVLNIFINTAAWLFGGFFGGVLRFVLWLPANALNVISLTILIFGIMNAVRCAAREIPLIGRFEIIKW